MATVKSTRDSQDYLKKKAFFNQLITVYGRKPVLEMLLDDTKNIFRLHLADSNRSGGIVDQIMAVAVQRKIEIRHHSRSELSRISRNSKQDQGVACDVHCAGYQPFDQGLDTFNHDRPTTLIAVDGVTNPQNLGMIIRSVAASPCEALVLPTKGVAEISPLVIKASAGTVFKSTILRCNDLCSALLQLKKKGFLVVTLSSYNATPLSQLPKNRSLVYVLGNESDGVSNEVANLADLHAVIPMHNGVESLNVAVTAALVAFNQTGG